MKQILKYGFLLFLATLLFNCTKQNDDLPQLPEVEVDVDKVSEPEEFTKVELIFHEGHTHGLSFHGDVAFQGAKYWLVKQKRTYTFEDGQWVADTQEPIRWMKNSYYALEIIYYNKEGERVNSEIIDEADVHQHFFEVTDVKSIKEGVAAANKDAIFTYLYRDTNPEDQYYSDKTPGVQLLNKKVGLKGYFTVNENYQAFTLKVSLAHFAGKKGEFSHTQFPLGSATREFLAKVPIRIFHDRTYNGDDAEEIQIQDFIREFKITQEQVDEEIDIRVTAEADPESSQVWF